MATWVEELGCFTVHANHTLIVLILIEGGLMWSLEWGRLHISLLRMSPHLQDSVPIVCLMNYGAREGHSRQNTSKSAAGPANMLAKATVLWKLTSTNK